MKKLFSFFSLLSIFTISFSQSPDKMSYQAVVRNSTGILVSSSSIGMQISILKGSSSGSAVYVETHSTTTNVNGLVSIEVGNGTVVSGIFSGIDWSDGPYFIKTETDPSGGTSYSIEGTSQLLSVPFAQYATDVENNDDADSDPSNEIQALSISNDTVYLENGGFAVLPSEVDGSVTNELQMLNLSNDTLYLSDGNFVYLGILRDADWNKSGNYITNTSDSIGIGTSTPNSNFDLNGSFRYTDGNQAKGKVLVSDSLGNATWDSLIQPTTFEVSNHAFTSVAWINGDVAIISHTVTLQKTSLVVVHSKCRLIAGGVSGGTSSLAISGIVFPGESLFHNAGTKVHSNLHQSGTTLIANGYQTISTSRSKILGPGTHSIRFEVAHGSNNLVNTGVVDSAINGYIIPY